MAHWFHRNVFKATTFVDYNIPCIHDDVQAAHLCSQLRNTRQGLLQVLPDVNYDTDIIENALKSYLSLLMGLLNDPNNAGNPSKLRFCVTFKWTNTLLGNTPQVLNDSYFEIASIFYNIAIWYMKHASLVAAKNDLSLEEAKDVHLSLKKAAGIFQHIHTVYLPQLGSAQSEGGDLEPKIVGAYSAQCIAEAQEVTLARAIHLNHNLSLISTLAHETSKLFSQAASYLRSLEKATQWKLYLQLKSAFYEAFANKFCAENLLSQDKCGEAIRSLKEAVTCYEKAEELCKEYSKEKGPAPKVAPQNHPFFRRFAPALKLSLEKCERENGFIYHQKIPLDPPVLEDKASYGLADPEELIMPPLSKLWSSVSYAAFKDSKFSFPEKALKPEKSIPPVKETPIEQSSEEPKNESGCLIQ